MEKKEFIYEGKAKQVYSTDDENLVIIHYKDDATAGNGVKKGTIKDKGMKKKGIEHILKKCSMKEISFVKNLRLFLLK